MAKYVVKRSFSTGKHLYRAGQTVELDDEMARTLNDRVEPASQARESRNEARAAGEEAGGSATEPTEPVSSEGGTEPIEKPSQGGQTTRASRAKKE